MKNFQNQFLGSFKRSLSGAALGHRPSCLLCGFFAVFFALDKRPAPFGMNALKGGKKKWHIYICIYEFELTHHVDDSFLRHPGLSRI